MGEFDYIIVGTGFAGSLFLKKRLEKERRQAKFLVLERGARMTHAEQIAARRSSSIPVSSTFKRTGDLGKNWNFSLGFGGGSNCWWAGTPRFHPNDFRLKSVYGVGRDWPLQYDDLVPYYEQAERIMNIAGTPGGAFGDGVRYPQRPHRHTDPEKALKNAYPDQFFNQPTARARESGAGRNVCCANSVCHLCPIDAKFTVQNGLKELYDDPRVTLMLEAEATAVDVEAGVAKGVRYKHEGEEKTATGDCVVLAANAIFNPHILLASGLDDGLVGKRLHEQGAFNADVDLDGIDNFQGSTSVTGLGYMLYDGDHRREAGAALLETWNVPAFRTTPGKWRQKLQIRVIVEDLPTEANYVALDAGDVGRPRVHFDGWTSYFSNGVKRAKEKLPEILAKALPVEAVEFTGLHPTEAHIQGTTMMGDDAAQSVVDRYGLHHHVRNLVVLGSSLFPTSSPANPTLTLSAMALLTGERL